jgi:phosphatidylglycerol:prolipoprotein diacylglycerol transferase
MTYVLHRRRDTGLDEDRLNRLMTGLVVSGFAGAKALYLFLYWDTFRTFGEMLAEIRYGFVFFGGFLGAAAWGFWFLRRHGASFRKAADVFAPALALGHAFGRVGCFAAGCCYGAPTDLPWGLAFRHPESAVPPALRGTPLHPTQLYEAGLDLAIFAFLHFVLAPRAGGGRVVRGSVFAAYVVLYGGARFFVETLRADDRGFYAFGLSVSQWVGLLAAGAAAAWLARRHRGR